MGVVEASVDRLTDGLGASAAGEAPTLLYSHFHELLHAQRSVELSRMPEGARTLLSAGCSGRWYYDWLETAYGHVERHIGVELHHPRPETLPEGAEWLAASVAHMPQVADRSVDLVFSGQNIEHLFGDDLVGFLLECARVVHVDGYLVMDSPNRDIARLSVWSGREHTIEFTPEEAAQLVELAGFDVTALRGVWLTRDPSSGSVMHLDPYTKETSADALVRRIQLAARYPQHSFVWWLEAKRAERAPRVDQLRAFHARVFAQAWPERANRFSTLTGIVREQDGMAIVAAPVGTTGFLMFGPYMPLAPAQYEVRFDLRRLGEPAFAGAVVAVIDVVADGCPEIASHDVRAGDLKVGEWTTVAIQFDIAQLRWAGEFRVRSAGTCDFELRRRIELDDRGSPVWPSTLPSMPTSAGG